MAVFPLDILSVLINMHILLLLYFQFAVWDPLSAKLETKGFPAFWILGPLAKKKITAHINSTTENIY
jgi:hypothetical protein